MSAGNLHYLSLLEISALLRSRDLTCRSLTETMLDRIGRVDRVLNSYVTVMADRALADAKKADAEIAEGNHRGPLHGVPVALKDLVYTVDAPTSAGMSIRKDWLAPFDASVVRRLRDAGAVILGKLAMTEAATFPHHPDFRRPVNPWNPDAWAGASSSGSGVATAAGLCFGSLGSDTGGSIRLPSAANNLTGLKPTWGRVSRHGIFPMVEPLDTVGPMARSAADAAALFDAIAGYDPLDSTSVRTAPKRHLRGLDGVAGAKGLVIGIDRSFNDDGSDQSVMKLVYAAAEVFADLGAVVREVQIPSADGLRATMAAYGDAHLLAVHEDLLAEHSECYGELLRRRLDAARDIKPSVVALADIEKQKFEERMSALLGEVHMLLLPMLNRPVPMLSELAPNPVVDMPWMFNFSGIFNYAGGPILSLPCGSTREGVPVGFQLMGGKLAEARLLKAGHAYQQATDWHLRHPPAYE